MNTKILGALIGVGVLVIGVVLISNWTKVPEEVSHQKFEVEKSEIEAPEIESPTNAYMEYYKALNAGDMKEVKKYLAKSMVEQLEQSGMEDGEILEMIQSMASKEVEIIDESIKGDNATIIASGIAIYGYTKGTIEMIKEDKKWKLSKESWIQGTVNEILEQLPKEKTDVAVVDILFSQIGKDKADLKIVIKNNGKVNIPQPSYTFLINESEEYGGWGSAICNFKPGEEREIDFSHAYPNYYNHYYKYKSDKDIQKPFELKMVLILDPKDELKEFNEGNNKITKIFYLQD